MAEGNQPIKGRFNQIPESTDAYEANTEPFKKIRLQGKGNRIISNSQSPIPRVMRHTFTPR